MKESFVFYRSFYEAIETLEEKLQLELYKAIANYCLNQVDPKFEGLIKSYWILIVPQLKANYNKSEAGAMGREYGILGGRPKKNPLGVIKKNPLGVNAKTPNVNVNVNDNENVKKRKCFFKDSIYFDKNKFKEKLPDWSKEKLLHYYTEADVWSNEGNKKIDWIATVKNWARRDELSGKEISSQRVLTKEEIAKEKEEAFLARL